MRDQFLMASSSLDKYVIDPEVIFLAVLLGDELESSAILFETYNERIVL